MFVLPVRSQLPFLPKITLETFKLNQNQNETLVYGCVRLCGLCILQILDQKANLSPCIKFTEERLRGISRSYFKSDNSELTVSSQATRRGVYLEHEAERVAKQIETGLRRAKEQRQAPFLLRQGKIAGGIFLSMLASTLVNSRFLVRSHENKTQITQDTAESISAKLDQRKK